MMRACVYTDGACSGNPGPGGWAAVFPTPTRIYTQQGRALDTTNNRMELTAIIEALKCLIRYHKELRETQYNICSDSAYCINAITKNWLDNWRMNDYHNSDGQKVKNADLWRKFVRTRALALKAGLDIEFVKVKGHANDPLNELADELAVKESKAAREQVN